MRLLEASAKSAKAQEQTFEAQQDVLKKIRWEVQRTRQLAEISQRAVSAPILNDVWDFYRERQLSFAATLDRLAEEELSFARFGDGELRLMLRPEYKLRFQANSPGLQRGLRDVFEAAAPRLLIGMPHLYRDMHWSNVWTDIWYETKAYADAHANFGNSHVSRPVYFEFEGEAGVERWRRIWDDRRVIIVTGAGSRFTLIDELFSNVRDLRRVESLPTGAFADVGRLLGELTAAKTAGAVVLVSLGPAGTVLAAELARQGVRAIDIGHISDSYQTVFQGALWPEKKPLAQGAAIGK